MITTIYVKLDSWHEAVVPLEVVPSSKGDAFTLRVGHTIETRCGREIPGDAPTSEALPLEEPSCETCLRLARHDAESTGGDT